MKKKFLAAAVLLLLGLQFVRPEKNVSSALHEPDDITALHPTPPEVKAILARACYDCHSDTTRYPWYAEVQPVGWWLAQHVHDGKRHLNFSQFGKYDAKRATRKMNQLVDETREHEMPLASYRLMHRDAQLFDADLAALEAWAQGVREHLAEK